LRGLLCILSCLFLVRSSDIFLISRLYGKLYQR